MSPYMKSRVEKAYGAAKCKIYAAVIVNMGFLDIDSKAFLEKQEVVRSGQVVTQFFKTFDDGLAWIKAMIVEETSLG